MERRTWIIVGLLFVVGGYSVVRMNRGRGNWPHSDVCAGPPLATTDARLMAMVNGYTVDSSYDCIDKRSVKAADVARTAALDAITTNPAPAEPTQPATGAPQSLADARRGFTTVVSQHLPNQRSLPQPPANLFVRVDYPRSAGGPLPAFVTPDPKDGRKHPAIVWLTGGDSNALDDFWTTQPSSHDETASAIRNAGVVMMFPTLRDGSGNPGAHEFMYGEVDDVLAAADRLAQLPYVDPDQIYLGGHSTGGTLVLLVAETSGRFKSVFAFGPASQVDRYPSSLIPVEWSTLDDRERRVRSPRYWLDGITVPTYLIEGRLPPSNASDVTDMCAATHNPQVHCIIADGADHFSVLHRVNSVLGGRLAIAKDIPFTLRAEEFASARR